MPAPLAADFRVDVVAVVRKAGAPLRQITTGFGISDARLRRSLKVDESEDGGSQPTSPTNADDTAAQLCEARKRIKFL